MWYAYLVAVVTKGIFRVRRFVSSSGRRRERKKIKGMPSKSWVGTSWSYKVRVNLREEMGY